MAEIRTAFTDEQYANPYPPGVETHYWYLARNRILVRKLRPLLGPGDKVLDIGCGPGIVVDYLRRVSIDCSGVDLGSPSPATTEVAPFLELSQSAFELDEARRQSFKVLLLMDVLEHLPKPHEFLRDCEAHFPNAQYLFVTLPARMEIWSTYDEYYGHHRRYALDALSDLVSQTRFRLASSGYFFHLLYTAARAVKAAGKARRLDFVVPKFRLPHAVLAGLFDLEEAMMPRAMRGSSVYAMFERQGP